jgi:Zn-dependent peptidase ImmA (M78 family)
VPARVSSKIFRSRLVEVFANRAGGSGSDAKSVLRGLLSDLRKVVKWTRKSPQLERAQMVRGILCTEYKVQWDRDGSLEPIGKGFDQGFKLTLNARSPKNRVRFTQAHELCHTFFYQYVPEIKFQPHAEDPAEEQLCNFGAAELLMPEYSLRREVKQLPCSIQSLLNLAAIYSVSPEAMMIRLRSLHLWTSELYIWQRAADDFIVDRIIGDRLLPWKWSDIAVPMDAWARGRRSGHSYLECEVSPGNKWFKPIAFDIKRVGNTLIALSGVSRRDQREEEALFQGIH